MGKVFLHTLMKGLTGRFTDTVATAVTHLHASKLIYVRIMLFLFILFIQTATTPLFIYNTFLCISLIGFRSNSGEQLAVILSLSTSILQASVHHLCFAPSPREEPFFSFLH